MSSMPMLSRMKSGLTPAVTICSSVSWLWVVVAGWMARLFGVADVGQVAEKLEALDEFLAGYRAALDAETEDRASALRQILLRALVIGMAGQAWIAHPGDPRMRRQERGNRFGVVDVAIHAQAERLDALDRLPAIERRLACADVAQHSAPGL